MKALVVLFSVLMSFSAVAADFEAMSWSEILKNSAKYDLDRTNKIHFQKASTWTFAMDSRLCTDGNFIYGGTRTLEICDSEGNSNCYTKKLDLVQPIVGERQRCVSYSGQDDNTCTKFETVVYVQSPQRTIKILANNSGSDNSDKTVLGTKTYSIPACSQLSPVPAN